MRKIAVVAAVLIVVLSPSVAHAAAKSGTWTFTNSCRVNGYLDRNSNNSNYSYTAEVSNCSNVRVDMRWFDSNNGIWLTSGGTWTSNSSIGLYKVTTAYPDWSRHYGKHTNNGSIGSALLDCNSDCLV
jgi:hypothetical protein